jgi:hypothetical protein
LYEKKYILIIIGVITGLFIFSSSFNSSYYSGLIRITTISQSSLSLLLPWGIMKNARADDGSSDDIHHHLCPPGMHYDESRRKCVKDIIFEEEDKYHGSGRCPNSFHVSPSIGCQPVMDSLKDIIFEEEDKYHGSGTCPNSSNRSSDAGCEIS